MAKTAVRRKVPPTRYPWSAERFYVRQLLNMVNQLGKVTLQVFDEQIKPQIKQYKARQDTTEYKQDAPLDVIRQAIEIIKGLSLGIFSTSDVQRTAERFVRSVNEQSKASAKAQGAIHNVDPTTYEPWLNEFMRSSIAENVGYISAIRDEYFPKIESIIYQGVKKGQTLANIRQGLVDRVGMTRNRAQFIAVDQTGTIFGQMTAKRHQEMGVSKFEWVDSGDNRVRPLHRHYNGNIYEYTHPPADGLPGEPFRCRCVAAPVFDDDVSPTGKKAPANFKEFASEGEVKSVLGTEKFINSLTDQEKKAITYYTTDAYEEINSYLRHQYKPTNQNKIMFLDLIITSIAGALNKSRISDNIKVWREVEDFDFVNDPRPGKKFGDLAFTSTTPLPKESTFIAREPDDKIMIIDVPSGTHGAYIEDLTESKDEKELLLQKGMAFEIMKIDGNKMFCKVVGEMSQNDKSRNDSSKEIRKDNKENKKFDRSDRFTWKKGDVIELN